MILDFRDQFDMEPSDNCKFDKLEIRDGSYGYSPRLDMYCGHSFPPQIRSSGSSLWLRFKSDDSIEYKGFRAVYWFEKRKNISKCTKNHVYFIVYISIYIILIRSVLRISENDRIFDEKWIY